MVYSNGEEISQIVLRNLFMGEQERVSRQLREAALKTGYESANGAAFAQSNRPSYAESLTKIADKESQKGRLSALGRPC